MKRSWTILAALLLAFAAAWPGPAAAARLMGLTAGSSTCTDVSGFTQVIGPNTSEPEYECRQDVPPTGIAPPAPSPAPQAQPWAPKAPRQ